MTTPVRKSLLRALAAAVLAASCQAPVDVEEETPDLASEEQAVTGVSCSGAAPGTMEQCAGTGPVYVSALRVGSNAGGKATLAQTFTAANGGPAKSLALSFRRLRPAPEGATVTVELRAAPSADPFAPGALLAQATRPLETVSGETTFDLAPAATVTQGTRYTIVVRTSDVTTGTALVGVAVHTTDVLTEETTWRLAQRGAGGDWRKAAHGDLSFRFVVEACPEGYTLGQNGCDNVNECEANLDQCDPHAICTDTVGGYTCECGPGWEGTGTQCSDVNECATKCTEYGTCTNADGSYSCECNPGWAFIPETGQCVDVNECATNNGGCHVNADCVNTLGARSCMCKPGYSGDGVASCTDIDECATNTDNCDPNATCTNGPGTFTCTCVPEWTGNGTTCTPTLVRDGTTAARAARSCKRILDGGYSTGTKAYYLDPDEGSTSNAFLAYCDMSTAPGGWTVLVNATTISGLFDSAAVGTPGAGAHKLSDARINALLAVAEDPYNVRINCGGYIGRAAVRSGWVSNGAITTCTGVEGPGLCAANSPCSGQPYCGFSLHTTTMSRYMVTALNPNTYGWSYKPCRIHELGDYDAYYLSR